uniref:Uncharacterized protein n=1 Tax=Neobodo designis TaxID=312471 RepID=A0A7S1MKX2_NEODS|eukprot:CAMPEP_0174850098 /NCGR_PEP_ID=MMETSP1114-20130205/19042_1 /TAXON_ID=312471 /ORGANISM="Neobodo designis, Strain CCAP 1951/1" /LENGTH=160 /DNA_ID=CAMNT_0016084531 /DNA_START=84 /DNA_END=566 /DNA_ORIENTATION=-
MAVAVPHLPTSAAGANRDKSDCYKSPLESDDAVDGNLPVPTDADAVPNDGPNSARGEADAAVPATGAAPPPGSLFSVPGTVPTLRRLQPMQSTSDEHLPKSCSLGIDLSVEMPPAAVPTAQGLNAAFGFSSAGDVSLMSTSSQAFPPSVTSAPTLDQTTR